MQSVKFIDPTSNPRRYTLDDLGLSYLYADNFKDLLRYVKDAKNWYFFNGCVWEPDTSGIFTSKCAKDLATYFLNYYGPDNLLGKRTHRDTMIKDAMDVSPLTLCDFDSDLYLLNCLNGTIDLRTGQFRGHNAADFLSKKANVIYDPDAKCERWAQFIREVMCGDEELADYTQKAIGYGMSGDTSEECLFILFGPTTRNGKGTFMETIHNILGDYSRTIQPNSLARGKSTVGGPSADIARLAGVRFVNASELASDIKLDAAKLKQITGGDTVTTRFLYREFFEFRPQFKIFINTNHLPEIRDDTLFSSGRLKLIPFDRHFADNEQDKNLKKLFRGEQNMSGILNWMLEGYKRYKAEGLKLPAKAEEALREYRKNSDVVGLYIESRLAPCNAKERTKTSDFHRDFLRWCKKEGVSELTLKGFVGALRKKSLIERDEKLGNYIRGYKIDDGK